jgi:uncharacterized protein YfaS (alpha-2-macroglobulin family)
MKCKASVTLGLVVGLWSAGCASDPQPRTPEGAPSLPRAQEKAAMSEAEAKAGLTFEVESTGDTPSGPARAKVAVTRPLDAAAVGRLLGRLEPLAEAEAVDFKLPTASRPAPKAGETVKTPFPPPAAPDATAPEQAGGPQAVLRYAPEGDVELVPRVSVTFAQPVVPISGVADVESLPRPVKLTPEPEGQWRWVGTRTVVFEPTTRMPMATTYSVEATADGEPTRFTFQTPPARLVEATPSGRDVSTRPVLALLFDQRVSPEAVQAHLQVKAGSTPVTLRPATLAELEADPQAKALRARAEAPERVVLLTPTAPLPTDAAVQVVLPRGLPSAEGPRVTEKVQQHGFQTYAALALESAECGWGDQCRPFMPWTLRFNNRLDEASVDASRFTVTPEVPDLKVEVYDRVVTLTGLTRGRTEYTVALSPQLTDQFGQRLGETKPVTFKVGPAEPALFVGHDPLLVLDPAGPRQLSVHLVNHDAVKVRIWRVSPAAWPAYLEWRDAGRRQDALTGGELVQDGEVKTGCPQDALHELGLPLDAALSDGLGHAVVEVSALPRNLSGWQKENPPTERLWVQSTRLGLDVFRDPGHLLVWATRLGDGAPKGGVKVQLAPAQASAATGDDGLATLALPEAWKTRSAWVEVRDGADVAFLPETTWRGYGTQWSLRVLQDNLRIFTFDDRGLYRPGEKVSVKGWLRTITPGPKGDVAPAPAGGKLIWRAKDPRGSELAKGVATLSAFGGFELELSIPADANLGYASVELDGAGPARGAHHVHGFQIQEFRRPEFEVSARATEGPYVLGDRPVLTAEARYFAGGALAGATTRWSLSAQPGHFSPPGQDDFQFGHSVPWWWDRGEDGGGSSYRSAEGLTDATGAHRLKLSLDALSPPRPYVLSAEATVEDVNHQAWSARTELLVHPGQLYVGLRPARTFVEAGEPLAVAAVVADLEGRRVAGRQVDLQAERLEWVRGRGDWRQEVAEVIPCPLTSAAEPATCTLTPEKGGQYRLRARVKDDAGRLNETLTLVWVSGQQRLPDRDLEELKVELVPDKDQYQPGDVARILVVAPFAHAQGLLTLRREGLLSESRFEVDGSTHTLEVPITEGHLPSLELAVHLVGAMPRGEDLPERPAFAAGRLTLPVPATVRALTVSATPKAAALRPGEATEVAVQVTDAQGAGVEAEVALVVVDEAVLALAGYALQDPLTAFYAGRSGDVADYRLRSHVRLANPEALAGAGRGGGGAPGGALRKTSGAMPPAPAMEMMREASVGAADGAFGGAPPEATPIAVRKDFSALALFAPAVRTDAAGRAKVPVKVPDNLTRYRVMAVAVDAGRRFGKGEAQLVARLPLMVRPAPPRFARFGDTFELPVVLENQSERPLDAQVALRAANLELTGGAGFTASVPAQDRVEVRFNVAAARPGEARFQVAAASGPDADAATLAFPVYTPATTEAFATYGTLTKDAVRQPVARPKDAVTSFGGLEVSTASTQLQALTDAFIYLYEYPYGCSEQVASRLLSVTALKDVLQAFHAPGLPEASALTAAVNRDLEKLTRLQNQDGGWGFWRVGQPSWPFLSVHVAHALFRAEAAGYAVPKGTLHRAHEHIRAIERYIPGDYSPRARRAIMAYALYARALRGDLDDRTAQVILRDEGGVTKADMEILGWLYPVLIDGKDAPGALRDLRRQLATRVTEEAGTAHFVTGYSEGAHLLLHSDRRVDGLLLEGVLMDTPESDLIPKLAAGLLAHRVQGRWHNTQESVWVLLALNRYFRSYEKVTPDFVARVWLGDGFAGEHRFQGRTTETHQVDIPMAAVPATETPLWIAKDGPGRLYYRVGMRYAPQDLRLAPLERGFSVVRRYAGVDDPADVRQDADGTWRIKAGATVKVSLQMVAPSRRYHVALMDPLPAGLEPLNPALAMSPTPPPDPAAPDRAPYGWWWYRPWYEHENLRDDRVEAFAALLWEGVHDYTYYARATTPGRFVASPTKAEEMYAPEVFGRSGTDVVVVE